MPIRYLWNSLAEFAFPRRARRRLPRRLDVERLGERLCPSRAGLSLTAGGQAAGLSLSTFVDGSPTTPARRGASHSPRWALRRTSAVSSPSTGGRPVSTV
jgi:hypothetical protein